MTTATKADRVIPRPLGEGARVRASLHPSPLAGEGRVRGAPAPATSPDRSQPIRLSTYGDRDVGLVCRKCGCREFRVIYTRRILGGIRRARQCRHCGSRRVTVERD